MPDNTIHFIFNMIAGSATLKRALPASRNAATTGPLNDTAKSSPKGVRKVIGGGSPGLAKNSK